MKGFYNNFNYDAFYLKGVTLYDKKTFATAEIGTSYRYITTNLDGTRRMDTSFQLVQNNNICLNVPFTLIGIGRSNNYIENFCIISTLYISVSILLFYSYRVKIHIKYLLLLFLTHSWLYQLIMTKRQMICKIYI